MPITHVALRQYFVTKKFYDFAKRLHANGMHISDANEIRLIDIEFFITYANRIYSSQGIRIKFITSLNIINRANIQTLV